MRSTNYLYRLAPGARDSRNTIGLNAAPGAVLLKPNEAEKFDRSLEEL